MVQTAPVGHFLQSGGSFSKAALKCRLSQTQSFTLLWPVLFLVVDNGGQTSQLQLDVDPAVIKYNLNLSGHTHPLDPQS